MFLDGFTAGMIVGFVVSMVVAIIAIIRIEAAMRNAGGRK